MEVGRHLDRLWRRRVIKERTRVSGRLIEDPWIVAPGHDLTPFDVVPRPPFRWQMFETGIGAAVDGFTQTGMSDSLDEVMAYFASELMPPRQGLSAMVLDESFRVVVGWVMPRWVADIYGQAAWIGTAAGFEWLRDCGQFDTGLVEAWEMTARMRE